MKTIINLYVMISLLSVGLNANAQTSGFTGQWKRNDTQSDPGESSINSIPATVDINQDPKTILIKTEQHTRADGVIKSADTLYNDGTPHIHIGAISKRKKQCSLQWSIDKSQFTETISIVKADGTPVQKWVETYGLSDMGKALHIDVTLEDNGKIYEFKEVFDRVK